MKNGWSVFWRIFVLQIAITLPIVLMLHRSGAMDNPVWLKLKPSILFMVMALVLVLAKLRIQNGALSLIWGRKLNAPMQFWQLAQRAFVAFYIALGIGNAIAAYTLSTQAWVTYKMWVPLAAFSLVSAILGRQLQSASPNVS